MTRDNAFRIPDQLDVFYMLAAHTTHGILITNTRREILYVNNAFTASTGYTMDEARGQNPRFLQSGHHDASFYKKLWQSVHERGYWQGEIWNRRKNGEILVEWQNIMRLYNAEGRIAYYGAIFSDITERKRIEEDIISQNQELEKLATSDSLTGLANRYLFNLRLDGDWRAAQLTQRPIALILIDVDHFKLYNDKHGHLDGDLCLRQTAAVLSAACRENSRLLIARYGGEEFALILPGADAAGAQAVAEEIRLAVDRERIPHRASPTADHVTISVGVASCVPQNGWQAYKLVQLADQALYRAKAAGRNCTSL